MLNRKFATFNSRTNHSRDVGNNKMKNMKYHILIFILLNSFLITSCSNNEEEDDLNITNRPPNNFLLLQVENNSVNVSLTPVFSWESTGDPDGDSVNYTFLMNQGLVNPSTVILSNIQTNNFTLPTSLDSNTTYSWQVIAFDGNGESSSSDIFNFTTQEDIYRYKLYYMQYPYETNINDLTRSASITRNNEGSIIERNGGVFDANLDPAVGFTYRFSEDIYDEITYIGGKIILEKKSNDPQLIIPTFKRTLFLNQNQQIIQKIIETSESPVIDTLNYEYDLSGKLSSIKTNLKESFFYFNNNDNLDSIISNKYNDQMQLIEKTLEKFEDYDNAVNPIKNLSIFEELFTRSLSVNNYSFYLFEKTTITQNSQSFFSTYREWNLIYDNNGNVLFNEF